MRLCSPRTLRVLPQQPDVAPRGDIAFLLEPARAVLVEVEFRRVDMHVRPGQLAEFAQLGSGERRLRRAATS